MDSLTQDAHLVLSRINVAPQLAGRRLVVGIVGPPGSGKSTLAARVVTMLNETRPDIAALVPMDGFHLDNAELDMLGLRAVKGAPQTFDAAGFVALLQRARQAGSAITYPVFDRIQDKALPDAARIDPKTQIIIAEGNYLLLPHGDWAGLGPVLDIRVMLRPSLQTLETRLTKRWLSLGLDPQHARDKVSGNDLPNARLVLQDSMPADLVLQEA